jgi:HlyD family secretion protein
MKTVVLVVCAAGALVTGGGGVWYWWQGTARPAASYRTATVERGTLLASVAASGTIEPEEVVDVGAQVAGQIKEFGRDPHDSSRPIDYGSEVQEGTVLARLDDSLFKARVEQARGQVAEARAQIAQADADLQHADADLEQTQAKLYQAERDWHRAQRLGPAQALSQADFDTARATYETTKAGLALSESAIAQAKAAKVKDEATLARAQAALREAETNLGYTVIRSPVKGVIVDRRVNVGQTVVAGLNAPSLFLIAKDLGRLQVWVSVNEADIGNIHPGQTARFTVDAYPHETFVGMVQQIRLNASMTQNVVIYTVVVNTDNSNRKLLPYLTANLQFEVGRRENAPRVPNAALRWKPLPEQVAPDLRAAYARASREEGPTPDKDTGKADKDRSDRGTVWLEQDGFVRPVALRLGLTDGTATEVLGGDLPEGTAVVISEEYEDAGSGGSNPFLPRLFRGKRN